MRGAAHRPEVTLPGFDGRGVTIALLDTGVDRAQPFLRGRIQDGINVLSDGDFHALAATKPDDATRLERHGTEMAGLLVGDGGPAGLEGVSPGASVLPIRVAGWQQDLAGGWAVYSRTDQLIAGLERAVDPNEDGDAHDAARIALVPLAAPYAAFADGPDARAVEGALDLDTLVVTAAGNDGPGGPAFGSGQGWPPLVQTVVRVVSPEARSRRIWIRRSSSRRGVGLSSGCSVRRPTAAAREGSLRRPRWTRSSTKTGSVLSPVARRSSARATTR